jgi:hypothetical protein
MHSYKFISQLQHTAPNNPHPLLLHAKKGGHGGGPGGKPMERRYANMHFAMAIISLMCECTSLKDAVDKWAFITQSLGLVGRENKKV